MQRLNLTEVVNNKNLIVFNQLYQKFERLLHQIQEEVFRVFDVRLDQQQLDLLVDIVN